MVIKWKNDCKKMYLVDWCLNLSLYGKCKVTRGKTTAKETMLSGGKIYNYGVEMAVMNNQGAVCEASKICKTHSFRSSLKPRRHSVVSAEEL